MSKGSTRRPTDEQAFETNYDRIFGRKAAPATPTELDQQFEDNYVKTFGKKPPKLLKERK